MAKAKRNKHRRKNDIISPIITVLKDGFLGGLLLIAISHGVHVFTQAQEEDYAARQAVFKQFIESKNIFIDNINACLASKEITKKEYSLRLDAREKLVKIVGVNKNTIQPDAFFALTQYTRLVDSDLMQNICLLNQNQLMRLRNTVNDLEVRIRHMEFAQSK